MWQVGPGVIVPGVVGGAALRLALSSAARGHTALLTERAISGIATALVGLSVLTGRFGVVRAIVIRG